MLFFDDYPLFKCVDVCMTVCWSMFEVIRESKGKIKKKKKLQKTESPIQQCSHPHMSKSEIVPECKWIPPNQINQTKPKQTKKRQQQ